MEMTIWLFVAVSICKTLYVAKTASIGCTTSMVAVEIRVQSRGMRQTDALMGRGIMSRYIDADALIERWNNMSVRGRTEFDQEIMVAPSIDIVRCKECKYWKGDGVFTLNALGEEEKLCKWWSKFGTIRTAETDFCSYGERSRR